MSSKVKIVTEHGDMVFDLYDEQASNTVANFKELINKRFYDDMKFHRVIPGFVCQGGCPRGDGSGGPGYRIPCETQGDKQRHDRGVLSMAHAGKDTGGSQFFIVHSRQATAHLDGLHTCFGSISSGDEIIDKIKQGDKFSIEII